MLIGTCKQRKRVAASVFLLSLEEAFHIVDHQVRVIEQKWQAICDEAALTEVDRALF